MQVTCLLRYRYRVLFGIGSGTDIDQAWVHVQHRGIRPSHISVLPLYLGAIAGPTPLSARFSRKTLHATLSPTLSLSLSHSHSFSLASDNAHHGYDDMDARGVRRPSPLVQPASRFYDDGDVILPASRTG